MQIDALSVDLTSLEQLKKLTKFDYVRADNLRINDLDFQEHANNVTFCSLYAGARYDFLKPIRGLIPKSNKLVLVKLEVDYLKQLFYGLPVYTTVRVEKIGRSSLVLAHQIIQDNVIASEAKSIMVHYSTSDDSSASWPSAVTDLISK